MDAFTTALMLLSRRELSTTQLRQRLARRRFAAEDIELAISRLTRDGTLDDRRVALTVARLEAMVRRRGRRRVLQKVLQLGVNREIGESAVAEVFDEVDEAAVLDQAIARRLQGTTLEALDGKGIARVVRALVAQGFTPAQVYARLRRRGADIDE
jgi:regulatory protein